MICVGTVAKCVLLPMSLWVAAAYAGGCAPTDKYAQYRGFVDEICDGNGSRTPAGSEVTYYELVLRRFASDDEEFRRLAPVSFLVSTGIPGTMYSFLLDAYIDGGQYERLLQVLQHVWEDAPRGRERAGIARVIADAKMRYLLWTDPLAEVKASVRRCRPPRRGWSVFGGNARGVLAGELLATGDEVFREAWRQSGWAALYKVPGEKRGAPNLSGGENRDSHLFLLRPLPVGRPRKVEQNQVTVPIDPGTKQGRSPISTAAVAGRASPEGGTEIGDGPH